MANNQFESLRSEIMGHESNAHFTEQGLTPLFIASPQSKIIIIGQAPGIRAQTSGKAWDDASGLRLISWLGVNQDQFRDASIFAHLPMDFYYPGKGASGDLPPRKIFAPLWHNRFSDHMPEVKLTILIGRYAQQHYLKDTEHKTLTETVRNYHHYLPDYFPLVHPSPLNFRWFAKNPWYETDVTPVLQQTIADILNGSGPVT